MTLRDYQTEACAAAETAWQAHRSIILNLATSAGKTVIMAELVRRLETSRCLVIADQNELVKQPIETLEKMGIKIALEKSGDKASLHSRVVVASAQTLQNESRLARFHPSHFDYIFSDEAHRGSDRNKKIHDYFSSAKICGFTATAFRANLKDLSDYYEIVAYEMGAFDLIDGGYSPPMKVIPLPIEIDISQVKSSRSTNGNDFDVNELGETITPYYEAIADAMKIHAAGRQILSFHSLIKCSEEFRDVCRLRGIKSEHVDGKSENRAEILERFRRKEFSHLSNAQMLTTGVDIPAIDCILNLRLTRSAVLYRQIIGRGMRVLPSVIDGLETATERKAAIAASGKPDFLILDILAQHKMSVQNPASLIAGDEEEAEGIYKAMRNLRSPEDIQKMSQDFKKSAEDKLRSALNRRTNKEGILPQEVALMLHNQNLIHYSARFHWESKPATDRQLAALSNFGLDVSEVQDMGHASAILNVLCNRRGLATVKQLRFLERKNIETDADWTISQASDKISSIVNGYAVAV